MDNNECLLRELLSLYLLPNVSLCFSQQVTGSINSRGRKQYILVSNAAVSNDKTNAKHI